MIESYRLIWSSTKDIWIVVAEKVASKGGPRAVTVTLSAALLLAAGSASALPSGSQVMNGTAGITTSGSSMTITNSAGAIINWQGFSIANGETTRFIQPSALSAVLNRVTGGDPSKILGTLQSNGKVLLINPSGIIFGAGARVDVNGLIASTLDITNQDFLAGKMKFTAGAAAGKVENQGVITTPSGGTVYLIAADVNNSGVITAPNGDVLLAAGKEVLLVDSANPEIAMVVSAPEGETINLGTIVADAGRVGMYGSIVRQKGRISADSAVQEGGKIFLRATKSIELADTSVTSADGANGGTIIAKTEENGEISGTLTARGMLSAQGDGSSGSGGFIETSAAKVNLNGVNIKTNGGSWLIDPVDFVIASSNGDTTGTLISSTLEGGTDVTILSSTGATGVNGDILVNEDIAWATPNKLSLIADGGIVFNANITAQDPGSALSLTAATTVSQGARFIIVGNLALKGTANYLLDYMLNDIKTVASNTTGSVNINNGAALAVGSADGVDGITGGTAVTLVSGGSLALNKNIAASGVVTLSSGDFLNIIQDANASITANSLNILSGGAVSLPGLNQVTTIAANLTSSESPFTFEGTGGFSIGAVGGTTGVSTNGGIIAIRNNSTGAITIDESVAAGFDAGSNDVTIGVASGAGTATVATGKTINGRDVQVYTSGGNITINGAVTGTTSANIHAGTGAISTGTTGLITAPTITLQNDPVPSGDIGASGTPFKTSSPNADIYIGAFTTYGPSAVYLNHTGDATVIEANLSTNSLFSFLSSGNLTVPTIDTGTADLTLESTGSALASTGNLSGNAINMTAAADFSPAGHISATTNLTIDLTGAGSKFTRADNINVGGTISTTIKADKMDNSATGSLGAAGSTVTLLPKTSGQIITLGSDNTDADLNLTTNELNTIIANTLRIGDNYSGVLNIGAAIAPTNITNLVLGSGSTVSQDPAGTISVANLGVKSLGSADLSTATNLVTGNIAAGLGDTTNKNSNFKFKNSGTVNVGTVDEISGISAQLDAFGYDSATPNGVISLTSTTGGAITQSSGALLAAKAVQASGTSVTLTESNPTEVISGAATSGNFSYRSANTISLDTVDSVAGLTKTGSGQVILNSASGISQKTGIAITASGGSLELMAKAPVTLTTATNNVSSLSATLTGSSSLDYTNSTDLLVTGVSTADQPVIINTNSGTMSVTGNISAGTSYVALKTPANLSITGGGVPVSVSGQAVKLEAADLSMSYGGSGASVNATDINIAADTFTTSGAVELIASSGISIQTLTDERAITVGDGANGTGLLLLNDVSGVIFQTPKLRIGNEDTTGTYGAFSGDITVGGSGINKPGLQLGLTTAGIITQNAGVPITVDSLLLISGSGNDILLNGATNMVHTMAAQSGGNISFTNGQSLTIGSITGGNPAVTVDAIKTPGGSVALTTTVGDITVNAPGIDACYGMSSGCTSTVTMDAAGSIYTPLIRVGSYVSLYAGGNVVDTDSSLNNIVSYDGNQSNVSLYYNVNGTIELDAWGIQQAAEVYAAVDNVRWSQPAPPPPPPPPAPTIDQCIANPALSGCSTVLPSLATCTSTPATPGCAVVLPSLATCTANPATAGCTVVLPSLATCTVTPALPGCTAVLPTLTACTSTPSLPGCSAVLPSLTSCITTPSLPGCSVVLPTLATCTSTPTAPGCSVVLPNLTSCITTPSLPGCSVILPTLTACMATPSLPGCSVVLPSLTSCITTPLFPGCNVVLPTLTACTVTPSLSGCSVVLPSLAVCTATPSASGCSVVLPSLATCTTAPTTAGCSVVLPTLTACTSAPATPGCSVVLPSLATCTATPSAPGCSVVLPSLVTCTVTPTAAGCSAVLPTLTTCATDPTAPGCSVVLPPQEQQVLIGGPGEGINLITQILTSPIAPGRLQLIGLSPAALPPAGGNGAGSGGSDNNDENQRDEKSGNNTQGSGSPAGDTHDTPKNYCN
ncbi:MAG: filamentous hemagglutinin N-terminal domain-containing protein [Desulfuromonadaceae bacterium]|nr:filamentous hemagglutinin N-terminal domain-containing protein [Desulfuromonadaceae bacterium]